MQAIKSLATLADLPISQFLAEFWQKKPLLCRQTFPQFVSPLSPEELAGFSLEEEVHSRLVVEKPGNKWEVKHGPFKEKVFSKLPASKWTLLVQHVDVLNEEVNALLSAFRFIPNWRLDDIMISYAADQGSVGPHFDYYDVFLLQAAGKRRWKIGQRCDSNTPLLPNQDMKILADFQQEDEFVLEPGDMLYLPPGIAHWGIAEGECMTISIGFRAPSHADLLLEIAQDIASELSEDQRYCDPDLAPQDNPGEINGSVIEDVYKTLQELINDKQKLADIFGRLMTEPKHTPDFVFEPTVNDTDANNTGSRLAPTARCAWTGTEERVNLFVNGESWSCSRFFALTLASYETFDADKLSKEDYRVFEDLGDLNLIVNNKE